jgi:hypothetical protein
VQALIKRIRNAERNFKSPGRILPGPMIYADWSGGGVPGGVGSVNGHLNQKALWAMSIMSVAGMIFITINSGEMQYTNMTIPTTAKTIN